MPPATEPARFDPQSHTALFATILAEMKADREERAQFRAEVKERFDKGTERMDALDTKLDRIEEQTTRTNGRVTRLESRWKAVTAKLAGALLVLTILLKVLVWLYETGFRVTAP